MAKITYYDFSYMNDAGFHALGFQRMQKELGFKFEVSKKVPLELKHMNLPGWLDLKKPSSVMIYRFEDGSRNFLFGIDSGDFNGAWDEFPGYNLELIKPLKLYFKENYLKDVFKDNPELEPIAGRVIPIPITFGLKPDDLKPFRPKIVPFGGVRWPQKAAKRRLRLIKNLLTLEEFTAMRQIPKDLDVFFVSVLYRDEELQEMNEWRLQILKHLSKQISLNMLVGFVSQADDLPEPYAGYRVPRMDLETYMHKLAGSKIGLYVRGTFDAISYKFGQLYALGKPIVGQSVINNRDNLYQLEGVPEQFRYDDAQELVERIVELIHNPQEMDRLSEINKRVFDDHLSPPAIARLIWSHLNAV